MRVSLPTWSGLFLKYLILIALTPLILNSFLYLLLDALGGVPIGLMTFWICLALVAGSVVIDLCVYLPRMYTVKNRVTALAAALPANTYTFLSSNPIS